MKKFLIILLVLAIMASSSSMVFAQRRGALTNVFASWYSVTTSGKTISFPSNSRDIYIRNGSSVEVFVSLTGGAIPNNKVVDSVNYPYVTLIDKDSDFTLTDYVTDSIRLTAEATASPVTVIVTY